MEIEGEVNDPPKPPHKIIGHNCKTVLANMVVVFSIQIPAYISA